MAERRPHEAALNCPPIGDVVACQLSLCTSVLRPPPLDRRLTACAVQTAGNIQSLGWSRREGNLRGKRIGQLIDLVLSTGSGTADAVSEVHAVYGW